jgi:hypothetical protein
MMVEEVSSPRVITNERERRSVVPDVLRNLGARAW